MWALNPKPYLQVTSPKAEVQEHTAFEVKAPPARGPFSLAPKPEVSMSEGLGFRVAEITD